MRKKVKINAKINFTLNVTGKTEGYHDLDSVVLSVCLCDEISVSPRKDGEISVKMTGGGEDIPKEKNNAYKAAILFGEKYGASGADIVIKKNIPIGKGLGGSSADAVGVLLALKDIYGIKDDLTPLAAEIGSDCPYMLLGGCARISGRGEKIKWLPDLKMRAVMVFPDGEVDTAAAYRSFDEYKDEGVVSDGDRAEKAIKEGDEAALCEEAANALAPAAERLCEGTAKALDFLRALSPSACSVTGSGSAVFAVFPTKKSEKAATKALILAGLSFVRVKTVGRRK